MRRILAALLVFASGEWCFLRGACESTCDVGVSEDTKRRGYRLPVLVAQQPSIYVLDDFATPEECHSIWADGVGILRDAATMNPQGKSLPIDDVRSGLSGTLQADRWSPGTADVVRRMDAITMMPHSHGQYLQLSAYKKRDRYELHTDGSVQVGRQLTALLFRNDVEGGGGELAFPWADGVRNWTTPLGEEGAPPPGVHGTGRPADETQGWRSLPKLDSEWVCNRTSNALRVEPRIGRLVVFNNHDQMGRMLKPYSLHGSCPVKDQSQGVKRIAQRWYQWFPLHGKNLLGSLLEQVGLSKDWKVPSSV